MAQKNNKFLEFSDFRQLLVTADRAHLIPDGAASAILNILSDDKAIQPRPGSRRLGNEITDTGFLNESFVFKKRSGFQIPIRRRDTVLEYYGADVKTWYGFGLTLTTGKQMGFAPFNNDVADNLYFGNGANPSVSSMYKWIGAICRADGTYAGGAGNITVKNPTNQTGNPTADFAASGNIIVAGVSYAYSAKTATTLTVGGGFPAVADGVYIIIATSTVSPGGFFANGTIFLIWNSRLVISGVQRDESAFIYSASGNPEDFVAAAPRVPGDPGIEDFPEGGGPITSISSFQDKLLIMKQDGVRLYDLVQANVSTDEFPVLKPLTMGIDVGPANHLGTAVADNDLFYVTSIGGVKSISRAIAEGSDNPNLKLNDVTEPIYPTVKNYDFSGASSVYFKKKVFIACKETVDDSTNNVVICVNTRTGGISLFRGWAVASWFIYNKSLYFNSSVDQNTYECVVEGLYDDNGVGINASWTSKEFTFGTDAQKKVANYWMVTGLIKGGTNINVVIRYENEGFLGTVEKTIASDGAYVFQGPGNPFGVLEFGMATFGAPVDEVTGYNFFRVFLTLPLKYMPYRSTITFFSQGTGQSWIITGHAPNPRLKEEIPKNLKL